MNNTPNKNTNNQSRENNSKPLAWFVGGFVFAMIMFIAVGLLFLILSKPDDSSSRNAPSSTASTLNSSMVGAVNTIPSDDSSVDTDNAISGDKDETTGSSIDNVKSEVSTVDSTGTIESDSASSNNNTNNSDNSYNTTPGSSIDVIGPVDEKNTIVWITESGSKYHSKPSCSNMKSPKEITLEEAEKEGYEPCKRCH